jgi:hypothetical protein
MPMLNQSINPEDPMKNKSLYPFLRVSITALSVLALAGLTATPAGAWEKKFKFDLVRSPALKTSPRCVPDAQGEASIEEEGPVEILRVKVEGLPPKTDFDFFVIQVPNGPFGMSWYQGDIDTNEDGEGHGRFIGRFSIETFVVAPGSVDAPLTFEDTPNPSVSPNPKTGPIQMYHLGLWFNSPADAVNAGCPAGHTPFNGEHDAGPQVLNTSNFPDLEGPLINVNP